MDVVELRREGLRLAAEVVKTAQPVRGVLTLREAHAGLYRTGRTSALMAMLVAESELCSVLEPLHDARVVEIGARGLLVVGTQHAIKHRHSYSHRQAWWARVVPGAARP